MTPLSLSSEFQFPFKDTWLIPLERKDRLKYLTYLEEGENEPGESEDPGLHHEWDERLQKIDPEMYERLKNF